MSKFSKYFYLAEGGNLSINNKYYAQQINLEYLNENQAKDYIRDLENLFRQINKIYTLQFQKPLWEQLETLIQTNRIYAGSSKVFAEYVKEGKFDSFRQYKKKIGDTDIQFCEAEREELKQLLGESSDKLGEKSSQALHIDNTAFSYYGEGGTGGTQLNCLFGYKFGVNMETGEEDKEKITYIQIDFEPVEFRNGIPTKFSQFSHSASFDDMQDGIKGVFHKFLTQSLLDASNKIVSDIKLYTYKSQKATTRKGTKLTVYSFSIDKGFRDRYVPAVESHSSSEIITNDAGQLVYFDIKNNTEREEIRKNDYTIEVKPNSELARDLIQSNLPNKNKVFINPDSLQYRTDLDILFELIFGVEPTDFDRNKFNSFNGLLELIKTYKSQQESDTTGFINAVYLDMVDRLYSPSAQLLYKRTSKTPKGEIHEDDFNTKQAPLVKMQQMFPEVQKLINQEKFEDIVNTYYNIK